MAYPDEWFDFRRKYEIKIERMQTEIELLKSQIKLLETGLNKVRFEAPTIGIAKDISNSYLAEFLNNEFNRLAEMNKVDNDQIT